MIKNLKWVALFAVVHLFSASIFGQKSKPKAPQTPKAVITADPIDANEILGIVEDHTYTNKFFGFELKVPDDMTILERPQQELYSEAGIDIIKSKADGSTSQFDSAYKRTINLLVISKLPPGTSGNSAAEFGTTKQMTGVTSKMVMAATASVMTSTGSFKLVANLPSKKFGGFTFVGSDFESTAFDVPLDHRIYITMHKGFSLVISITTSKDAGFTEFEDLFENIKPIKK